MIGLYFDTSVIVTCYCEEIQTLRVKNYLKTLKAPPMISSLTLVELYSALSIKIKTKQIKKEEAQKVSSLFEKHLKEGVYKKVILQEKHYSQAKKMLNQFCDSLKLRALDALHLSIASKNLFEIITLDQALIKSAKFFNIQCNLSF